MEVRPDNLLGNSGFNVGIGTKVNRYLNLEGNPFTRLSNLSYGFHNNSHINKELLFYKMVNCNEHHIQALILNTNENRNNWRILEILYHYSVKIYGKRLQLWDDVVKELNGSFDENIKIEDTGKRKLNALTYSILFNFLNYIENEIEEEFELLDDDDITWRQCYDLFTHIITFFPEQQCTCNDYIYYPKPFLDKLSLFNKHINNLENTLNNVSIDYELTNCFSVYLDEINKILEKKIPLPKIITEIKLPYDLLSENHRLDFIQSSIKDDNLSDKIYCINNSIFEAFRKLNKCFICDIDIKEINYNTYIKKDNICELISERESNKIYPITYRCFICRNQPYGKLLKSNHDCIMARHYKWMVFYLGLQMIYLPKDVLWLIIMKYLYFR